MREKKIEEYIFLGKMDMALENIYGVLYISQIYLQWYISHLRLEKCEEFIDKGIRYDNSDLERTSYLGTLTHLAYHGNFKMPNN